MIFEWDENKRAINRERHKLDLIDVVWTERGDATRLISFRRARRGEETAYQARFG
jgi:uncharacterized DUF497 family protein